MSDRGTGTTPLVLICSVCTSDVRVDERDETICPVCAHNVVADLLLSIRNTTDAASKPLEKVAGGVRQGAR